MKPTNKNRLVVSKAEYETPKSEVVQSPLTLCGDVHFSVPTRLGLEVDVLPSGNIELRQGQPGFDELTIFLHPDEARELATALPGLIAAAERQAAS